MSITILDAREWQTMLDLRTGEKIERNGILIDMV